MSFLLNFFIVTVVVSALVAVLSSPWLFKILGAFQDSIFGVALETILVRISFPHVVVVQ